MIPVKVWTTIRTLHAQGKSVRRIARDLNLSRNTVRHALRSTEQPPRYQRQPSTHIRIEPFRPVIQELIARELIGSRILAEIPARGYEGSAATFYRAYAGLRPTQPDPGVTERFETAPGEQRQFDWSPYTILLGGARTRVIVYNTILGYSRRQFNWPSRDETQASIYEAFEEAFWHFGGVPMRVLVDNPRAFVIDARPAHFTWNPQFLELCGYYRSNPRRAPCGGPGRRAKSRNRFNSPSITPSGAIAGPILTC